MTAAAGLAAMFAVEVGLAVFCFAVAVLRGSE